MTVERIQWLVVKDKAWYESLLDTTVIIIEEDKDKKDRVKIKLSIKDMVDDEIVYKYFEGY